MQQVGAVPPSGKIDFAFSEEAFNLVAKKFSNGIEIEAVLSSPEIANESKKKVRIKITKVYPAGSYKSLTISIGGIISDFLSIKKETGITRAEDYMSDHILGPRTWLLFGEIQGAKTREICINYIPEFNIGAYALRKDEEKNSDFNPQLN